MKTDDLKDLLSDWQQADDLAARFAWKPHTLRARISAVAKQHPVERRRVDGKTSYRIKAA